MLTVDFYDGYDFIVELRTLYDKNIQRKLRF